MRKVGLLMFLLFSKVIIGQDYKLQISLEYPSNISVVSPEMAKFITAKLDSLSEYAIISSIEIASHTDSIGSFTFNQKLSQQRANEMADFLENKCEIDRGVISQKFYGFTQPIPIGQGNINRRTEIIITYRIDEPEDEMHKLYALLRKKPEAFWINNLKDTVLISNNGIQYVFYERSFIGAKRVKITIEEHLKISDMLAHQLSTTSNAELLETAGMFRVQAYDENGKKLQLRRNKKYLSIIPTDESSLAYRMFDGHFDEDSIINWTPDPEFLQNISGPELFWCSKNGSRAITQECPFFFCKIRSWLGIEREATVPDFIGNISNSNTDINPCGFLQSLAQSLNIDNFNFLLNNLDSILFANYGVRNLDEYSEMLREKRLKTAEERLARGDNLSEYDLHFFVQQSSGLGWRNIDYFLNVSRPIALTVLTDRTLSTRCFIIFKDQRVIIPLPATDRRVFVLKAAPRNTEAHLMVMRYQDGQAYFAVQEINTNQKTFNIHPEPVSVETLKRELQSFDKTKIL